jgi:hypothetical protein
MRVAEENPRDSAEPRLQWHSELILRGAPPGLVLPGWSLINYVLGIQYLDPWRACTLFLLLRRLSSEETMSTRLTHNLGCN